MGDEQRALAYGLEVEAMVKEAQRVFAGKSRSAQGAALADLTAIWVTGHFLLGEDAKTRKLWQDLVTFQVNAIQELIEIYGKEKGIDEH